MATAAVMLPEPPLQLRTPPDYWRCPFELPEKRFVGLLACQRDPLLQSLTARVTRCEKAKAPVTGKKNKAAPTAVETWEIELDDTVCFPIGGGQPSDEATIMSLDRPDAKPVFVREALRVGLAAVHLADRPLEVGERVEVTIDWERRLDLMTQHLGQHLLSAVLEQELQLDTPSWNLSPYPEPSYIELTRAPSPEELARVQAICNAHVRSNLSVHVDISLQDEVESRPPKLPADYHGGVLRHVTINGLDRNPCCGSHPPSLGLLQCLHISPYTTPIRGTNSRIYFSVGDRVVKRLTESEAYLRDATAVVSCGSPELADRVKTLSEDAKAVRKRERRLRTRLATIDAKDLLAESPSDGVVLREEADDDAEYLGMIVTALHDLAGPPDRLLALAGQPVPGETMGSLVVCGGPDGAVDKAGQALRKAFGAKLRGGGKGRYAGKLTGRWGAEELALLREAMHTT